VTISQSSLILQSEEKAFTAIQGTTKNTKTKLTVVQNGGNFLHI